jgi:hypothetical protein
MSPVLNPPPQSSLICTPLLFNEEVIPPNPTGALKLFRVHGNDTERNQALDDARPWMTQNNTALSKIARSQAWNNLRDLYQPLNS